MNSDDEYGFIVNQLLQIDPQHKQWYISGKLTASGNWINDGNKSDTLTSFEKYLLPEQHSTLNRDYVVFT